MVQRLSSPNPTLRGVSIRLPFRGRWLVQNSPARRVPSHGTDLMGERYAIDFVGVDEQQRTADRVDWRTVLATEPVERFHAFGRQILAPTDGRVVRVHDGEPDHAARRSQLALVPYALGQAGRLREGMVALAGNHVILSLGRGVYLVLAHLRAGSITVSVGESVSTGQSLAQCGNSGNSTQPHVHIQAMDSLDLSVARGIPLTFRQFREWPRHGRLFEIRDSGVPAERAVVEALT